MLDKVRTETRGASTQRTEGSGLGASNIMIHHSRDTDLKQWAETTVRTLGGVVKIINAQRATLLSLGESCIYDSEMMIRRTLNCRQLCLVLEQPVDSHRVCRRHGQQRDGTCCTQKFPRAALWPHRTSASRSW